MAREIAVQYQTGKTVKAYVYYDNAGTMTLRTSLTLTEAPAGSGLFVNATDITGLAAKDRLVIKDVDALAVETIIGGGEYKPEINDTTIDGIITGNAIIATIPTIAGNITTIDGYVNDIDGIITANTTIATIPTIASGVVDIGLKTVNLPADPASTSDITTGLAGLNDLSAAEVNAEVVSAVSTIKAKTDKLNFNADATPLVLAEIGVSSGAIETNLTINDNLGNPIADATAWVTTDADGLNVVRSGVTEDHGDVVFFLTPGTYWLYARKAGYTFTPTQFTVEE